MKINVYYGGRGLLDDPTLYVLKKMEDVLRELRVNIERFNCNPSADVQRGRRNYSCHND